MAESTQAQGAGSKEGKDPAKRFVGALFGKVQSAGVAAIHGVKSVGSSAVAERLSFNIKHLHSDISRARASYATIS